MTLELRPVVDTIAVRMGEMAVSGVEGARLSIFGLGSCIGVSLWDPRTRVGGMAHFMLPSGAGDQPPAKYVSGGLARFIAAFEAAGGSIRRAQVKASGGAAVLSLSNGTMNIGERNAAALATTLNGLRLSLMASDLGGTKARTIELCVETGRLSVRSALTTRTL